MTDEIARLIRLLDDDSTEVMEEARFSLMAIGPEVVAPLAAAVGSMRDSVSQLCAIQVFDHLGDPAAGPALIGLLRSEHGMVRTWATWSVGDLGVQEAVPLLLAAHERLRAKGDPPDWMEVAEVRDALTKLGARQEVLPPLTASLRTVIGRQLRCWPSDRLAQVVDDLADHEQAVLGFGLWAVIDGDVFGNGHERLDLPLDIRQPWRQVVEDAREAALIEAAFVEPRPNLFATVQWINRDDV